MRHTDQRGTHNGLEPRTCPACSTGHVAPIGWDNACPKCGPGTYSHFARRSQRARPPGLLLGIRSQMRAMIGRLF